jgi:hypothetical protein
VAEHRLTGAGIGQADVAAHDPDADRIRKRLREARPKAEANLSRLIAELGSVGIQDSHPGLVVIQAADGPIRFD